jgi:glucose-6-phosphate 1-epimerase
LDTLTVVARDGARALVYLHGAHVTSWTPAGGIERLFVSEASAFRPDAAIRGGVPVIFPQFANVGPLPKHGFARTALWTLVDAHSDGADAPYAKLRLTDTAATRAIWPHAFRAELTVSLFGSVLELTLAVRNPGAESFEFTGALHTYLRVDAPHTMVRGLEGLTYHDSTAGGVLKTEREPEVAIRGEINRIYRDVSGPIEVVEPRRSVRVEMAGFRDVVVWNPGPGSEPTLGDMESGGPARMVCVEAAVVATPVVVAPGEEWIGMQRLIAG